jgi:uncharacterized protein (UPF0332 family)
LVTWEEMSRKSLRAAKLLADQGHLRSSISRAYYAAYCAIAGQLAARGFSYPHGWHNPAHEQLPQMIAHNLPLPQGMRRGMSRRIRALRGLREDADYRPGASIDRADAIDCLQLAGWVLRALGIDDD